MNNPRGGIASASKKVKLPSTASEDEWDRDRDRPRSDRLFPSSTSKATGSHPNGTSSALSNSDSESYHSSGVVVQVADIDPVSDAIVFQGYLKKRTNFFNNHAQEVYFVLRSNDMLYYYKVL